MSGHNKWSKVKHTKGPADAKRSKVFSKLAKEITIAARSGGDPDLNPRLRTAVLNARKQSLPGENIDRAIKKGTGELAGEAIEEILYEGFGPGGIAFLVEVATDNKNRSAADVRSLFTKHHGNLGTPGSVAYLFERKGEIRIPAAALDEEKMLEAALEAGADDVSTDADDHVVLTAVDTLFEVAAAIAAAGLECSSQKLVFLPKTTVAVADPDGARQVLRLAEILDDYDDTQNVYANFDIADSLMESLSS